MTGMKAYAKQLLSLFPIFFDVDLTDSIKEKCRTLISTEVSNTQP